MGMLGGLRAHVFGAIKRKRIGGDFRTWRGQTGQLPNALAALFRFKVPQRTIHGVACRAGGQKLIKALPVKCLWQAFDLRTDRCSGLIIAGIRDTFTPAFDAAAADFDA